MVARCGGEEGHGGHFIAAGRRTVDAVQRAPAVVRARRRPVERCGYVAGRSGNRLDKEGRRGACCACTTGRAGRERARAVHDVHGVARARRGRVAAGACCCRARAP